MCLCCGLSLSLKSCQKNNNKCHSINQKAGRQIWRNKGTHAESTSHADSQGDRHRWSLRLKNWDVDDGQICRQAIRKVKKKKKVAKQIALPKKYPSRFREPAIYCEKHPPCQMFWDLNIVFPKTREKYQWSLIISRASNANQLLSRIFLSQVTFSSKGWNCIRNKWSYLTPRLF